MVSVVSSRPPMVMVDSPTSRSLTAPAALVQPMRWRETCTPMVPTTMVTTPAPSSVPTPRRTDSRLVGARKWRRVTTRKTTASRR